MRLPISWLKDYVDFEDTPQGLADKLTFSGTEVEGILSFGSAFEGIVVGEVVGMSRHPNADRLTVCQVSDGTEVLQVVCGAPNVKEGGKYPLARVNATLKGGFTIKKAKLRGVESCGMLCAEDELGISDDHAGLMELPGEARAGMPLSELLGPPEVVLELEITPNRPDCLSVIGMAREVAALYGTQVKLPETPLAEETFSAKDLTRVEVLDPALCPRYTARILKDVQIGPSPKWMQKRLEWAGIRPINNVVDITNYVMMECGHPLHAFDQTLLAEGRIVVRTAEKGEGMSTLDGVVRELQPGMLVIADAHKPVALAGIMGGAGSEIRDDTTTVLLESAYFAPDQIRATSRRLGLSTDSSYRFERGTDVSGAEWASRRAASLMQAFAGAQVAAGVVDVYPNPVAERQLECRLDRLNALLGLQVDMEAVMRCFELLGLSPKLMEAGRCAVCIPVRRGDLEREVDLFEEFARWHGLDNVPEQAPMGRIVPGADDRRVRALHACSRNLRALGLTEIQNYSLVSPKLLDMFDGGSGAGREVLPHPISQDQSVLRTSLIPQMAETLGKNQAHQVDEGALFELGRVFEHAAEGAPVERERVSLGLMGPVGRGLYDKRRAVSPEEMFGWLKGLVEALFATQRLTRYVMEPCAAPYIEAPYGLAILAEGHRIGTLGVLSRKLRAEWRFQNPVGLAELEVEALLRHSGALPVIKTPGLYPSVRRDMALVVSDAVRHEDILRVAAEAAPAELEGIELFDIYQGQGIPDGFKSMAYSIIYRSASKTLTDEQANEYHTRIKQRLREKLGVEIREN